MFLDGSSPINPEEVLKKIIPTFWPFMIQLTAFIILIIVVTFLVYKPVKNILKKRKEYISNNIKKSEDDVKSADEKLRMAQDNLDSSYKESKEIINKSILEAEVVKENIIADAKNEAKKEIDKAKIEIENEVSKKEDEIKNNIVDVAILASSKVLSREVNKDDNKKIINKFIKDLEKEKQDER